MSNDAQNTVLAAIASLRDELVQLLRPSLKPHLTIDEVAELTGRTPYTVRRWVKDHRLTAIRVKGTGPRGRLLIPRDELRRLIDAGI